MTHPTESLLSLIFDGINYNVEDLKSVFWVDSPIEQAQLPAAVITSSGEEITPYNNMLLVNLSVDITWHFIDEGVSATEKILSIISACDQIVKDISGAMTIDEVSTTELEKSQGVEKTVLKCSKTYNLQYRRTRGL